MCGGEWLVDSPHIGPVIRKHYHIMTSSLIWRLPDRTTPRGHYPIRTLPHTTQLWPDGKCHDDVIEWTHFLRFWPFVREIHRSPVNSPHKGQWRGALIFSLFCGWTDSWANNGDAGDLRRYRAHYDVIVMYPILSCKKTLDPVCTNYMVRNDRECNNIFIAKTHSARQG